MAAPKEGAGGRDAGHCGDGSAGGLKTVRIGADPGFGEGHDDPAEPPRDPEADPEGAARRDDRRQGGQTGGPEPLRARDPGTERVAHGRQGDRP